MATKYKSFDRATLLSCKEWPSGLSFLKPVAFRRLFEQKVGKKRQWLVEIEPRKLTSLAAAAKRIAAIKEECTEVLKQSAELKEQLSKAIDDKQSAINDNQFLLRQVAQLTDEKKTLEDVNSKLRDIIEREPELRAKSEYRSPLADAPSRANTSWPLPGSFEGGRRK
jgi:septal ring factor EnvC (AmiA/AmiB activator)